jgi:ethanolamine utilization protein EutA
MIAEADLDPNKPAALAFGWTGRPFHARLDGVARAIAASAPPERPLILIFDADVAGSVGTMLRDELGWRQPIVCLDGITVGDFDYVDVGRRIDPSGAYPVVVKSLMFSSTAIGGDPK